MKDINNYRLVTCLVTFLIGFHSQANECDDLGKLEVTPSGELEITGCQEASYTFQARMETANGWLNAQRCQRLSPSELSCEYSDVAKLSLNLEQNQLSWNLLALRDFNFRSLELSGQLKLPKQAEGWLSNGFHSWSQTGVISISEKPKPEQLKTALEATGEDEVYRKGSELSWWHSYVGSDELALVAGVVSANTFKSWIQAYEENDKTIVRLMSGGLENIETKANQTLTGESWVVYMTGDIRKALDDYAQKLSDKRYPSPFSPPIGWNSWYDLWDEVTQEDIRANAAKFEEIYLERFKQYSEPAFIVLDDGWQKMWGDWTPNEKFKDGIPALVEDIQSKGMEMGIWLAPLLVKPDSPVAKEHPEWLVKGAKYYHPLNGDFMVLDVTHPEAAKHLATLIKKVISWGPKLLKLDFLFAGTIVGQRHQNKTSMQAYHEAMKILREAAGDEIRILAVGAPAIPSYEYADYWRVGGDIAFKPALFGLYPKPAFSFIANQARSIAGRYFLCKVIFCDGDPPLLRGLDENQVETGAWVAAAAGGALFLSDNLTTLDSKRHFWGLDEAKLRLATGGLPIELDSHFPENLPKELVSMHDPFFTFSAVHDIPSIWQLPSREYLLINFDKKDNTINSKPVKAQTSQLHQKLSQ